jgi:pentatricopeptide repeat protein
LGGLTLALKPQAFNELLRACSRDRAWEKALDVFEHMQRMRVTASTETYNALIHACYRSSESGKVGA